jgi:hypothetical protein
MNLFPENIPAVPVGSIGVYLTFFIFYYDDEEDEDDDEDDDDDEEFDILYESEIGDIVFESELDSSFESF